MPACVIYAVQPYKRKASYPMPGKLLQFSSERKAMAVVHELKDSSAEIELFRVEGDPLLGRWEEPELLLRWLAA